MKRDATSGMVLLIVGFSIAILAIVIRINMQTSDRYHRLDAERDFSAVNQKLNAIQWNQEILKKRQAVAMKKLVIDLLEPTTQP